MKVPFVEIREFIQRTLRLESRPWERLKGEKGSRGRGKMEEIWRDESLEAETLEDAVDMYAFDLGYQGAKNLPDWLLELGEELSVDVTASFVQGKSSR